MIATNLVVEWFSIRYQAAEKFSLVKSALIPGNSASKSFWGNLPLKNEYSFLQWNIFWWTANNFKCHIKPHPKSKKTHPIMFQQDVNINLYLTMKLNLVLDTCIKKRLKCNLSKTNLLFWFHHHYTWQKRCLYKMLLKKENRCLQKMGLDRLTVILVTFKCRTTKCWTYSKSTLPLKQKNQYTEPSK